MGSVCRGSLSKGVCLGKSLSRRVAVEGGCLSELYSGVKPCSHLTFFAPFFSPFKNVLNAFLLLCSHMTFKTSMVSLTKTLSVNKVLFTCDSAIHKAAGRTVPGFALYNS